VLQPPVVRPRGGGYELVASERRWRAARLAGLQEIDVLIREHDDGDSLQDALMENVAREDLSPIEAARAYATIIDDLGLTREELGRRIGQSRVSISHHLRLLDLPDEALDLIDRRQLSFARGKALLLTDRHDVRVDHRAPRSPSNGRHARSSKPPAQRGRRERGARRPRLTPRPSPSASAMPSALPPAWTYVRGSQRQAK